MGHEVGVTPLQMTSAMATIANGGKLVTPRIVKSITTEEGKAVSTFSPVVLRQVISPETAAQIGNALRGVVSDQGTAASAAVPGFAMRLTGMRFVQMLDARNLVGPEALRGTAVPAVA
jgi:stage V sporulation protein D (sporulation-specific penicillin-binding protein)